MNTKLINQQIHDSIHNMDSNINNYLRPFSDHNIDYNVYSILLNGLNDISIANSLSSELNKKLNESYAL